MVCLLLLVGNSELAELKAELHRVVNERDKLADDTKKDAMKLNEKIEVATKQGTFLSI
jgi:hypothetical protein